MNTPDDRPKPDPAVGLGRHEVGDRASSNRHPPHVTENDSGAPLQQDLDSPRDVAAMPANASGSDAATTGAQNQPIDDESMYDQRPEQDKNQPPSERKG